MKQIKQGIEDFRQIQERRRCVGQLLRGSGSHFPSGVRGAAQTGALSPLSAGRAATLQGIEQPVITLAWAFGEAGGHLGHVLRHAPTCVFGNLLVGLLLPAIDPWLTAP